MGGDGRPFDGESRSPRRPRFKGLLLQVNLALAAFLTFALMGVTTEVERGEADADRMAERLAAVGRDVEHARAESEDRFDALLALCAREKDERDAALDTLRESLAARDAALAAWLGEAVAEGREEARHEVDSLERGLVRFREELRTRIEAGEAERDVFRRFEEEHRQGVFLVHAEFDYVYLEGRRAGDRKEVTGWGTAFAVDDRGHVVTNKHVVQPWKFDPELAAMEAAGEIAIDRDSLRLRCWRCGQRALDDNGEPSGADGWDNVERKNLVVAALAEDEMMVDGSVFGAGFGLHALGDADLAILRLDGAGGHALPLARPETGPSIRKLDPVMALGFPRGQRGLERGVAETSPSIGTVRKAEDTIHVTASIIPGNSGGPLIGPHGRVVGVVTRVYSETLGICIRIERVLDLLATLPADEPAPLAADR